MSHNQDTTMSRGQSIAANMACLLIACVFMGGLFMVVSAGYHMYRDFSQAQEEKFTKPFRTECEAVGGKLEPKRHLRRNDYPCILDDGTVVDPQKRQKAIDSGQIEAPDQTKGNR